MADIGHHFPNTDPRWLNEPSSTFLRAAANMLAEGGWAIGNIDLTVIAESPKIGPRSAEIIATIAGALEIDKGRIGLKATTNERLGFIGRGEGIAALAVANIRRRG
jgi:2-C-methyl-D-erythritol 2,4-cyclodiphosphate synthase